MDKPLLTVIIPTKTEKFLEQTTRDVLKNATGRIEVIVVLNGYHLPENEIVDDPRVRYLYLEPQPYATKRHGINQAVAECHGDYVMSLDAHCMVAPGFDEQLINDHNPHWVQIPRRHRLDAENWCLQTQIDTRPPIDYEYIMWRPLVNPDNRGKYSIHGFKWDKRTLDEWNTPLADTIQFQGSCWFMTKEWFQRMGFMQVEGYMGWGQEAEEIGLTTWKAGGRVVTNKNTWYAHLHKGEKYGRMYNLSRSECRDSYDYAYQKWLIDNKEFFISLVEKFPRMPDWPDNWKEKLREIK